jgi:molybdate transport system regulatory protein
MLVKELLRGDKQFKITGMLRLESEQERFLGPGRLELLENIIETGSISKAAKQMEMSYKKAWEMINSINQQTKKPIVITQIGGEKGGGTVVTEEGKQIMSVFKTLLKDFQLSLNAKLLEFLNSEVDLSNE